MSALERFVKIAQSLFKFNIQRLFCNVRKFHVAKESIQSSSSLSFITNFALSVIMQKHNSKTATMIRTAHWIDYI